MAAWLYVSFREVDPASSFHQPLWSGPIVFPVWRGHRQANKLLFYSSFWPASLCFFLFEHAKLRSMIIIGGKNESCLACSNNPRTLSDTYTCNYMAHKIFQRLIQNDNTMFQSNTVLNNKKYLCNIILTIMAVVANLAIPK